VSSRGEHLELVPVLELEPRVFSTTSRLYPLQTNDPSLEAYIAFWKACIGDRGLAFEPIMPHSYCVALEALTARASDEDIETTVRLAKRIHGGYALRDGDHIVSHFSCCADLPDLVTWRLIFAAPPQEKQWLAHSYVSSGFEGDVVRVSILGEYDRGEGDVLEVPRSRVEPMLAEAEATVRAFAKRLLPIAGAAGWPDAEKTVELLTHMG